MSLQAPCSDLMVNIVNRISMIIVEHYLTQNIMVNVYNHNKYAKKVAYATFITL